MFKKIIFVSLFLTTSFLFSQVEKNIATVPEKPILKQIIIDSIQFPILPYTYDTSISDMENLNHILSNLFFSILITNNKIQLYAVESGAVTFIIDENGKMQMNKVGSPRKEYKKFLEKNFLILIQHFSYLDSIGKKITPLTNLNTNKTSKINYGLPMNLKREGFEDKYNRNTAILRGPMVGFNKEVPVQYFGSSFMNFSNKMYELLDLNKVLDTKKEIKLILKISKEGKISMEDAQSNEKSILNTFERKMKGINDWIIKENGKGNYIHPAINIYNEEVDYYLEFSNFSSNKE